MSDDKPTPQKPAAKKPAAAKSASAKSDAAKPAATTPAATTPAAKKPVAKKPAAAQPKPAAKTPAAVEPDAQIPESPVAAAAAAAGTAQTKPISAVVAKPKAGAATTATQPTDVIAPAASEPATASGTPAAAVSGTEPQVVVVAPPKRKRRIWPFVLIGIVVLLVIALVVGYVIGENYARTKAIETIKEKVVAVLHADPATVKVDIGTDPVLFQALAGKLNEVNVTAPSVTFGELSGSATLHAEDVPLDANAKTKSLDITFSLPEEQVASQLTAALGDIKPDSVVLEEPEITVNTTLDLFFFTLPVGVGLEPSAVDGALVFTPTTVTLGEQDYTPAELRKELGDLAEPFLQPNTLCVADALPVALTVTDVDVAGKELVLKIEGDKVALGGPDLSTNGTCEG